MPTIHMRRAFAALVASAAVFALAACGGSVAPKADPVSSSSSPSQATSSEATATSSRTASSSAPSSPGAQPAWAKAPTSGGAKISTITAGTITVDVYQVGTTKATKNGQFVDPGTNKPLITKGDAIVFVNYVITNTGPPVNLGASLVDVSARYDDWKYLQGMDSIVDSALFTQQKVNSDALAPGAFKTPSIYVLDKGQTYTVGENFRYQQSSPITFTASVIPVDAKGSLIHDQKSEGKGAGTVS